MSYRMTKEELDEKFELFLKESVSDDSVDFGGTGKKSSVLDSLGKAGIQKPAKKADVRSSALRWQDDDDDDDDDDSVGEKAAKSRFLKVKKDGDSASGRSPGHHAVVSETPRKPVATPRSKPPDRPADPEAGSRRLSPDGPCSVSLGSLHSRRNDTDSDSQGSSEDGTSGSSGRMFRKSLRRSGAIQEEDEEQRGGGAPGPGVLGRDSLEPEDSVLASGPSLHTPGPGSETLEEEMEKARFFEQMQAGASSTLDYSKLNREMSLTADESLRRPKEAEEQAEENQSHSGAAQTGKVSPDSPNYSVNFEDDEESEKEPPEKKRGMSSMLEKVSLHDSWDSTSGLPAPGQDGAQDLPGSGDNMGEGQPSAAQSYGQSGCSDVEALHGAYREISHSIGGMEEWKEERSGGPSPPRSPLEHYPGTHQPVSTGGSELPTAEELMKPIRPESGSYVRGFDLQPVSDPRLLETKFSDAKPDVASGPWEPRRSSSPPFPDVSSREQKPGRIREEVERLMRDQETPPPDPSAQSSSAQQQQKSRPILWSAATSSARRGNSAAARGRKVEGRAAMASRFPGVKTPRTPSKPPAATHRAVQCDPVPTQNSMEKPYPRVSSDLIASVQSFAAFLQHQVDGGGQQVVMAPWEVKGHRANQLHLAEKKKETLMEERCADEERRAEEERLRVELRDFQLRLDELKMQHREELIVLKQENVILQRKSAEEAGRRRRWGEAEDPVTQERLQAIEKEVQEQETLIKGYNQENEKLYQEMKIQQARSKATVEAMFSENQRLLNELAGAKEQLRKASGAVGNICPMDHTRHISELLAQIDDMQTNEEKLSEEARRLRQENQALDVDLQLLKKKRDLVKSQLAATSDDRSFELRVQEERHREEVAALQKKLHWYAENQQLLDRDATRLRAATAETEQLKEQLEKLQMEVRKRGSQPQGKAKERAGDAKRIQDLERQVKELEDVLRRRHPNSLPALIHAAAAAAQTSSPSHVTALLERKVKRLEAELEGQAEEAKRNLRALEQQFQGVKLRYNQHTSDLEQQLAQRQQAEVSAGSSSPSEPGESRVETAELERVKEAHRKTEEALRDRIDTLQQQLADKEQQSEPERAGRSPSRHQLQTEAAFEARIERLSQELASKRRAAQELSRTVERLQRERRNMSRDAARPAHARRRPATPPTADGPEEAFPAAQYDKPYQPDAFAGSHITEVLEENEALRGQLEQLELQREKQREQRDQEREALEAATARAQEELSRLKQSSAEQMSSLREKHLRELDHAQQRSSCREAELTNQLSTQQVMVQHLQEQLIELQGAKDALALSTTRENSLQDQLTKLQEELRQAREAHSPELKHLRSLEAKIHDMELRHQQRESKLQQVIGQTRQAAEAEQQSEVERWRRLAQGKSKELEAYSVELDSILDLLQELRRQGVVFPRPAH